MLHLAKSFLNAAALRPLGLDCHLTTDPLTKDPIRSFLGFSLMTHGPRDWEVRGLGVSAIVSRVSRC